MVLAAGIGSRLKPYTLRTPKPLMPLLGVPCIEYSLLQLRDHHVKTIVVNVHAHADQMESYLRSVTENGPVALQDVKISDESGKLLGSAGGFRKALPLLESIPGKSESFFSLNADVVSLVDLRKLELRHQELRSKQGVVMTLCLARGKTLGSQEGSYTEILVDEASGLITGIGAKKNQVPFYTGTAVFETEAFRHLAEGVPAEFTPEVLVPWIQKNKVGFFWMEDLWVDVGSPELWWKSHFHLLDAMESGELPASWNEAIHEGMKRGYFSKSEGVVDYDATPFKAGIGSYISFKGDRSNV